MNIGRKRQSPQRHTVHTKHPRYDVEKYPRGMGGLPKSYSKPIGIKCQNKSEVETTFIKAIYHTWGGHPVLSEINITVEEDPDSRILAKLVTTAHGKAYGDSLYIIPRNVKLVISPRFYSLSDETQFKTLIHEAGHLGYSRHDKGFFGLMDAKGGIYTESHGLSEGFQLQGKPINDKAGGYQAIKTFKSREELKEYAKKYVKSHPNVILRMVF